MKIKKALVSLFLIISLLFTLSIAVSANNLTSDNKNQHTFLSTDFYQNYYTNHDLYIIYDENNIDISESFYRDTINLYNNNNLEEIYNYVNKNVYSVIKNEIEKDPSIRGSLKSVKSTYTFRKSVYNPRVNDLDIGCTLVGRFTYNMNTGKVTSCDSPTLSLTYTSINGFISTTLTEISTRAEKVSNDYKVKFSCQFKVITTLSVPLGDLLSPPIEDITGPYSDSFIAYGT